MDLVAEDFANQAVLNEGAVAQLYDGAAAALLIDAACAKRVR